MSATIINMDYRMVDVLNADQLEVGDLIGIADDILKIVEIIPLKNGFALTVENEFGEKDIVEVDDYSQFELFILE